MIDPEIITRLDRIELLLDRLVRNQPSPLRSEETLDIKKEIAAVKARGGDLLEYFKLRAKTERGNA